MLKLKSISLAGLVLFATVSFAQTDAPPVRVVVDGELIVFPNQQPSESNGHVLVPLRGVFEKLGASVGWDPATQTVSARKDDTRVKITIGQLDASVNDKPVHMDVPATLVGGSTMVPLRFVSEALGAYVTWNAAQHEVDIAKPVNYDLPGHKGDRRDDHRDDRRDHPVAPPVPPRIIRMVPAPVPPRRSFGVIPADSVIPFALVNRLSSTNAQRGDQFTATVVTDRSNHYFDLPAGTTAYGNVSFVRARHDRDPGVIELTFDHLMLPNGRLIPMVGRLIGLDDPSIAHLPNGAFIARGKARQDRMMFSGVGGKEAGIVIGFNGTKAVADIDLKGFLNGALGGKQRDQKAHDIELRPGTQFGFRLYQDLQIPR